MLAVYFDSLPCFFVCFCFVFGRSSGLAGGRTGTLFCSSKTQTRACALKRARANVTWLWISWFSWRDIKSNGVDTVIVFARIFGAHFFEFLPCLYFFFNRYFSGTWFQLSGTLFIIFFRIISGGLTGVIIIIPEKKAQYSFFFLSGGLCNEWRYLFLFFLKFENAHIERHFRSRKPFLSCSSMFFSFNILIRVGLVGG